MGDMDGTSFVPDNLKPQHMVQPRSFVVQGDPPPSYVPKHMKPRDGTLTSHALDLLENQRSGNPWAQSAQIRALERYRDLWDGVDGGPFDRTPEDVVNYLGAEIISLIIICADMTGPVCDLMEGFENELDALIEMR